MNSENLQQDYTSTVAPQLAALPLGMHIPGLTPALLLANAAGSIHGVFADSDDKAIKEIDDADQALSLIPGVGTSRLIRRIRNMSSKDKANGHTLAHNLGGQTSRTIGLGAGLLAGALIGGALGGKEHSLLGSSIGGALGLLSGYGASHIADLVGHTAAKIKGPRTPEENAMHMQESVLPEYLIPGVAAYNKERSKAYDKPVDLTGMDSI